MIFFFQAEDGIRDLVRSRGLGDVYKRQKRDSFTARLKRTAEHRDESPFETELLLPNDQRINLEITSRMVTPRDDPPHIEVVARDVTERKRAEAAVHASEERLRACIADSYTHHRAHATVLDLVCRLQIYKQNKRDTIPHAYS